MFKNKELVIFAIVATISLPILGRVIIKDLQSNELLTAQESPQTQSSSQAQNVLQTNSLTVGILTTPDEYNDLAEYLRAQFGNKVQVVIDGDSSMPYGEVRNRLIRKEWDIAFTLSPMLSVAAKENGYVHAARMFPDKPQHYQAALFVKSDSPIQSLDDLKPTTTIALGDFTSASSFYMPTYDLFGKTLQVDIGNRGSEIREMVKNAQVEVGAAAYDTVKDDPDLRVIHISRPIPGSNVYLSPNLSEPDRQLIVNTLLNASEKIKAQANYGAGQEADYSEFLRISQKAEEILGCANFQTNPVNFFCPSDRSTASSSELNTNDSIVGRVSGWTRKSSDVEQLNLAGKDSKVYFVTIPRSILNQVPDASNLLALQNKEIQVLNVVPKATGNGVYELTVTDPTQLVVSGN